MADFNIEPSRYELRSGDSDHGPFCPYGNKFEWIGYDLLQNEYIRFTKSGFKKLVVDK